MNKITDTQEDLRQLYRDLILEHARSPRNFGKLTSATHSAEGINPLCGDKLKMYFEIDGTQHIQSAKFEGSGCAISVASASLLTETVIGLNTQDADDYFSAVLALLRGEASPGETVGSKIDLSKLKALAGVSEYPSRVKCATLAWHALNSAIHHNAEPATTE